MQNLTVESLSQLSQDLFVTVENRDANTTACFGIEKHTDFKVRILSFIFYSNTYFFSNISILLF